MGATTEKVYSLKIEMSAAQQALADAGKLLADMKAKAAAANTELRETKEVYQQNSAALKELVSQQKQLETAKKGASAGEPFLKAQAALDKNLAAQQRLNKAVQESKIDYNDAKAAAEAAGAAVGKQAGAVKELGGSVKEYGAAAKAAAQEFAPGTFGAIDQEVKQLRADIENMVPGSAEAAAAIRKVAAQESVMRGLANAVNAANPRAQARAFGVFSQALIGVTGVAVAGAQALGLSDENAQKYTQRMQGLIGVLYSVESVNKLLNSENISLIKSIGAGAKAWLGFGSAAQAASVTTRAALLSTGIGALAVLLGFVVTLFMDLGTTVKGSESNFTKYKAAVVGGFDAIIDLAKSYYKFLFQIATLDFSGAIKTVQEAGTEAGKAYTKGRKGVIDEARRAEIKTETEQTARYLDIIKSRGDDTLALEVQLAKRRIETEKAGSKEQLDLIKDYLVLKNQYLKREADEERAQALARLESLEKIESANGRAVIEQQRKVLQERLQQQIDADLLLGNYESAAQTQLRAEIQALNDAFDVEQRQKRQAAELARLDALISLRQAKGQEAYAQEVARAERELAFLKSAAQRDEAAIIAAQAHLNDLVAARAYELTQRRHALKLAELDAIISLENTKGIDSYNEQIKREEKALAYMKEAGTRNLAAEVAQQSKIDNLKAAHALKEEADERAADIARMNAHIAFLQAQGADTLDVQLQAKQKELDALLKAATFNEAAVIAKQSEINVLIEQQRISAEEKKRAGMIEDFEAEMGLLDAQGKDTLKMRLKFAKAQVDLDTDTSEKGLARRKADIQKVKELEQELSARPASAGNYLLKMLGVSDEDLPIVKQRINDAVATIGEAVGGMVDSMLTEGLAAADAAIQAAQDRLSELNTQLSTLSSKRQADEAALATATGAKRDYLLTKIVKERAEEQRLATEKAKAAKQEQEAQKEKAKLDKEQQQITAAGTAIEAIMLGIRAAQAVVDAADKGKVGYDNIALAIAAAVAIGASIFAVKNAAKSLGDGGVIEGGSHASGNDVPVFGGRYRVEGGEAITPVDATQRNGPVLELIRTRGRQRTLTLADFAQAASMQIKAPPGNYYAAGGVLGARGAAPAALEPGQVAIASADLSALVNNTAAMLSHLEGINGATQATASHTDTIRSYGPAQLHIGPYEAVLISRQKAEADLSASFVTI